MDTNYIKEFEKLQTQVARQRRQIGFAYGIIAVLAVASALPLLRPMPAAAQTPPNATFNEVRARMIGIVDERNRLAGVFGYQNGNVLLGLLDRNEQFRIRLVTGDMADFKNAAALLINSPDETSGIMIGTELIPGGTMIGLTPRNGPIWGVRFDPRVGLIEMMKDRAGTIRNAAHVNARGEFRYHVQKSALEQVSEMLTWAAAVRDLTR